MHSVCVCLAKRIELELPVRLLRVENDVWVNFRYSERTKTILQRDWFEQDFEIQNDYNLLGEHKLSRSGNTPQTVRGADLIKSDDNFNWDISNRPLNTQAQKAY